ncbi:MAG: RimK family alpha-L-glutamate ligase [Bdellovibrionales bacterium]|nr:RimK family alpha-L-glutamate ligase [Bdellovibrionales bacterium]
MRIAILSRNKNLHSIRRLLQEAKRLGVICDVVDPLDCQLVVEGKSRTIFYHGHELPRYDAVLPRIGASVTDYGIAVVKHFESMDTYVVNGSKAIGESRDKLRSLQVLSQSGVRVPATVLARGARNLRAALASVKEMPVILKVLRGTQGVGVMLVHSPVSLASVLETLNTLEEDVLIQEFLKKSAGRDYRIFVVGGKIAAAMLRTAPTGEFRSNIHRGGEGTPVTLPKSYRRSAIRAAAAFGLGVAGVDLMDGPGGATILEVNSSPGFEGIEKATKQNIAALIMRHVVGETRKILRRKSARKRASAAKRGKSRRAKITRSSRRGPSRVSSRNARRSRRGRRTR